MTHPNVTPDLLDDLIGRCKRVLAGVDTVGAEQSSRTSPPFATTSPPPSSETSASGSATYRRKASVTFLRIWKSPHAKPTPTPTLARSSQPLPTGRRPLTQVGAVGIRGDEAPHLGEGS